MTYPAWIVEPATAESLSDILKIEEACFSAPWTRRMLDAELSGNPFAHFVLARRQGGAEPETESIVGYLCYWIVFEEVRLMNLAVIESMRHRGIARSLVSTALQSGLSQSAHRAVLEVRASNIAAQCLYRGFGFRQVAVRSTYYNNPVEDAVLMELDPIVIGSEAGHSVLHDDGGHSKPLH
ncbi:MAG TPA: ribosomal protein S18-alanine N-acetyltransferase [Nitrospira sp.]|nr:ribosomal protein S18-alanine N-acetyltransferase [Nitrospira sp.]